MAKAKEITRIAKLEFNAGQAKPGPELAGLGIVMPEFTKAFNDATKERGSEPVPVTITVFKDKSFTFKTHTSPAAYKIKKSANIEKGSNNSKTTKVATISLEELKQIAEYKLPDLNTDDISSAMKTIAGTAKNMGVLIEGWDDLEKAKKDAKKAALDEKNALKREQELDEAHKNATENKEFNEAETIGKKDSEETKEGEENA